MNKKLLISFTLTILFAGAIYSQTSFSGFNYQAIIKNSSNFPLVNQAVALKIEVRKNSNAGTLLYDETQSVTTNVNGYVSIITGHGIPANGGLYSAFNSINWQDTSYFFNLFLWDNTSSSYDLITSKQIFSVPFALYSKKTAQPFYLSKLADVDTASISNGKVLKWNGIKWIIAPDLVSVSDTVLFAYNASHSITTDTANYALNAQNIIPSDTALWANASDSSGFATNTNHAVYSDTANYATTAGIANFANGTWRTTGNAGTNSAINFIGTTDANDLVFRTNDTARAIIKSNGRVGIGTATPNTDLHILGNNGFLFQGTYGTGAIPYQGAGTRFMWYPKKAAFRGGVLDATTPYVNYWDDANIGNYSFSYGKNNQSKGDFSVTMGLSNIALGMYSAAIGFGNSTSASYSFAAGDGNQALNQASVVLGRGNITRGIASVAIGYHAEANGNYSTAFGFYTQANGVNSVSMGYQCKANHNGCFIYNDASNLAPYLLTIAANQFMARAAGGFIFYTNSTATSGVTLAAGSGSWASLSDSTKKENFELVNYSDILEKVKKIKIYTWNYKSQSPNIRHVGPTAQEFSRLFNLGENNTTINTVDIDGVNMAAIKALAEKSVLLDEKVKELDQALNKIKQLQKERDLFKDQLDQLENTILNLQNSSNVTVENR